MRRCECGAGESADGAPAERILQWDLRQGPRVVEFLAEHIADADLRERVSRVTRAEARRLERVATSLPVQVVHGDASALSLGALDGDQLDLELDVALAPRGSVELTVRATPDSQERTTYRLRRLGDEAEFSLDRTRSSLDESTDAQPMSGLIPLDGDVVRLRVLVDHSALEAFANGVPLVARVYPTRRDATHIAIVLDDACGSLRAWRVASARI